jgi:peptide/nickel transport system substrate-binding protein
MDLTRRSFVAATLAASAGPAGIASAQADRDIVVGFGAAITSMDPHFHALTPNVAIHQHVYGALVDLDEKLGLIPGLAESWRAVDERTWEFRLRRGVKFHDGGDFTAEDVKFSYERIPSVPNSPGLFTIYTRHISEIIIVDPHTIRFRTQAVYPLMPNQLAGALIVSRRAASGASTADFNTGRATIGTGPYRFREYVPGDRVVLERNEQYFGGAQPWRRVTFRLMPNAVTRVAALKAGDVAMIDVVPPTDVETLSRDASVSIWRTPGVRNIYLYIDHKRDDTPGVLDNAGNRMARSPLKDLRVRQALSKAINREGIVRTIMSGQASPSGQFLPAGVMGTDPNLAVERFDPEGARRLLSEAGYPDGFQITIGGPNDRYINDSKIVEAIAQMWARVGLRPRVETMPAAVFFGRSARHEFSVGLLGWGTGTGEPDSPLVGLIATETRERGWGAFNRSMYSNARVDALIEQAFATLDATRRAEIYREATRIAIGELAIIPLHHQVNIWATRRGLSYNARNDERTMVMELRPVSS